MCKPHQCKWQWPHIGFDRKIEIKNWISWVRSRSNQVWRYPWLMQAWVPSTCTNRTTAFWDIIRKKMTETLFPSVCLSVCLSISLSHTHTHARARTHMTARTRNLYWPSQNADLGNNKTTVTGYYLLQTKRKNKKQKQQQQEIVCHVKKQSKTTALRALNK